MKDFIQQAIRTESLTFNVENNRLLHAIMGLSTEISELIEGYVENKGNKNTLEEIGDMLWYMGLSYSVLNITFEESKIYKIEDSDYVVPQNVFNKLVILSGNLLDIQKKSIFYGRTLDTDAIIKEFKAIEKLLTSFVNSNFKTSISELMKMNIEKLQKRYPHKFEDVLKRDVEKELSHIKV